MLFHRDMSYYVWPSMLNWIFMVTFSWLRNSWLDFINSCYCGSILNTESVFSQFFHFQAFVSLEPCEYWRRDLADYSFITFKCLPVLRRFNLHPRYLFLLVTGPLAAVGDTPLNVNGGKEAKHQTEPPFLSRPSLSFFLSYAVCADVSRFILIVSFLRRDKRLLCGLFYTRDLPPQLPWHCAAVIRTALPLAVTVHMNELGPVRLIDHP